MTPKLAVLISGSGTTLQNFLDRIQQMVIDQFCFPAWKYWIWQEIQAGRLPYPCRPTALRRAIARAIEELPENRYPTMAEALAALERRNYLTINQ